MDGIPVVEVASRPSEEDSELVSEPIMEVKAKVKSKSKSKPKFKSQSNKLKQEKLVDEAETGDTPAWLVRMVNLVVLVLLVVCSAMSNCMVVHDMSLGSQQDLSGFDSVSQEHQHQPKM